MVRRGKQIYSTQDNLIYWYKHQVSYNQIESFDRLFFFYKEVNGSMTHLKKNTDCEKNWNFTTYDIKSIIATQTNLNIFKTHFHTFLSFIAFVFPFHFSFHLQIRKNFKRKQPSSKLNVYGFCAPSQTFPAFPTPPPPTPHCPSPSSSSPL